MWPAVIGPQAVSITAVPFQPPGPLHAPLFFIVPRCPQLAWLTFLDIFFYWLLLVGVVLEPTAGVTSNFT